MVGKKRANRISTQSSGKGLTKQRKRDRLTISYPISIHLLIIQIGCSTLQNLQSSSGSVCITLQLVFIFVNDMIVAFCIYDGKRHWREEKNSIVQGRVTWMLLLTIINMLCVLNLSSHFLASKFSQMRDVLTVNPTIRWVKVTSPCASMLQNATEKSS